MNAFADLVFTFMFGALYASVYYIVRQVDELSLRVETLEHEAVFLTEESDEESEEESPAPAKKED
jgi:hypothetical protein